jgi:hypothetical protein
LHFGSHLSHLKAKRRRQHVKTDAIIIRQLFATLNDYKSHYRYLQRWLAEQSLTLKLEQLTADHVRQYIGHMLTALRARLALRLEASERKTA